MPVTPGFHCVRYEQLVKGKNQFICEFDDMFVRASLYKRREESQLDVTE
jgi:hypothetical protein